MPSSTQVHSRITYGAREYFYCGALLPFVQPKSRLSGLDIANGKVSVGGDGSKPIPFTSRPDVARYVSFVLTHLPADQLNNRSFTMAGDIKVRAFRDCNISTLMKGVKSVVQRVGQGI
jgi:hypothetical protein